MELNLLEGDDLKSEYLNNIDLQFYHMDRINELEKQYKKTQPYNRSDKHVVQEMFNLRKDEHIKALARLKRINTQIDTKINNYDHSKY